MDAEKNLQRTIPAGEIIKPWLILGPFYEDVSARVRGASVFEFGATTVGQTIMAEVAEEAAQVLAGVPREADEGTFRDQSARWSLVRRPDQYLSWGIFEWDVYLGAAFLSTRVTASAAGMRHWRLVTRIACRATVAIDGRVVYDTDDHPTEPGAGGPDTPPGGSEWEYTFSAVLGPGEHVLNVCLVRLSLMAQVGIRLECTDSDLTANVAPPEGLPLEERLRVEEEVGGLRLDSDVFHPEQPVQLRLEKRPKGPVAFRLTKMLKLAHLVNPHELPVDAVQRRPTGDGSQATTAVSQGALRVAQVEGPIAGAATIGEAGEVVLCHGAEIEDGHYHLEAMWEDADGRPVTSVTADVYKVTPIPPLPGDEHYDERRRIVLEQQAASRESRQIWAEVASYALGRYDQVNETVIREVCDFIAARKDCADFVLQGLLRLLFWERRQRRLSAEIHAVMKDTLLGFKYWSDEPGHGFVGSSENHRLLIHVAEWMAGQLFPTEEFSNSLQRGLYHATKGRMFIVDWLRRRGRFGLEEWHSSYYPVTMAPLVNIVDFCQRGDSKTAEMAAALLDVMFFHLAQDSLDGVLGTAHARCYGVNIKYPDQMATSAMAWLAYGVGPFNKLSSGMGPVSMATSSYRPPAILTPMALDTSAVVESYERQDYRRGYSAMHSNFCVYRTPDYQLSGVQDLRKGEIAASQHVAQVTFRNRAVIFWSCPSTSGEGSGMRPDYWSGNAALPRVIQHRNVLALTWRRPEYTWMTHCFFEPSKFDEVRLVDGVAGGRWAFGRAGKGYVAIWSQHGLEVGDEGQYAGRELQCYAEENTWLVECGREADWGSFAAFVDAVRGARIEADGDTITYASPSIGEFVTGWDIHPTVDGRPIPIKDYPMVWSEWAHSEFASGVLELRYGDDTHTIYLGD